jgi:hypothetical protein
MSGSGGADSPANDPVYLAAAERARKAEHKLATIASGDVEEEGEAQQRRSSGVKALKRRMGSGRGFLFELGKSNAAADMYEIENKVKR